ncbi:short-chain specific acyl-CoA dehydrogenase, mitochondrial-like [Planococcus citri]|uniref:short-chain specific acyl-CoA dehydrogenase, mitochondrial-like n=1 Tax=Planococcus citri TaxID=170843 RepID=UPI0031F83848
MLSKNIINVSLNQFIRNFSAVSLPESHLQLKNTCRNFAKKELKPIAQKLDKEHLFPKEQIRKLGTLGLMGILVSKEYGGSDMNSLALSVAVEELARGCGGTGAIVSIHNGLYAALLNKYGTAEQKRQFLPSFVDGSSIGSFALSEPESGSDAANLSTTATPVTDGWLLNGTKSWVTSAYEAKAVIVIALADKNKGHRGTNAYIIPIPTKGLTIGQKEDKLGIRASSTCSIFLENVHVTTDNLLGKEGDGFKIAMSSIDCGRIGVASLGLGIAQASLDCAIEYANARKAFGGSLLKLQAVQQRIARMALQLESARLLTWKAAMLRDDNQPFIKAASMAKLSASEAATAISHNCIQILGGMGYVTNMPAERYYRDARITEIFGGPSDIQLLVIAEQTAKEYGYKTR